MLKQGVDHLPGESQRGTVIVLTLLSLKADLFLTLSWCEEMTPRTGRVQN